MKVPASRYRVSERAFPEVLLEWEYGATDAVRKVCIDGTISYKGNALPLGKAFRGERVAVRPTATYGILNIFFSVHEIFEFDLREENPALKPSLFTSRERCHHAGGAENLPRSGDAGAPTQASSTKLSCA